MEKVQKFERVNPTLVTRQRVKEIRDSLPKTWRKVFISKYPEYNNHEGLTLIKNVHLLRTTDLRVTEILEEIAQEYNQRKAG